MGRSGRSLGAGGWGEAGEAEEEREISENVGLIFLPSKTAQSGSLWALFGAPASKSRSWPPLKGSVCVLEHAQSTVK